MASSFTAARHLQTDQQDPCRPGRRGNVVWAVGSVIVVAFGWLDLTTTGQVWALLQAAVVGGFAALQFAALKRG